MITQKCKTVTVQVQLEINEGPHQEVNDMEHEQLSHRVKQLAEMMQQKGFVRSEIFYDGKVWGT